LWQAILHEAQEAEQADARKRTATRKNHHKAAISSTSNTTISFSPQSPSPAPKTPAGVMPGAEHAPFATLAPQVCFPTSYDTDDDDTVDNKPIFNVPDIESPTFKQSRTRRPCRNRLIRHARLKSPLR
jgi:hypothetical protein